MSHVYQSALQTLKEIQTLCLTLNNEQFSKPCSSISGYSVGAHIRHSIEMFGLLNEITPHKTLCYDKRDRDIRLEIDPIFAAQTCNNLQLKIGNSDFELKLEIITSSGLQGIQTSFFRELIYCSEHATHHLAIIKIACNELQIENIPENLGVAYSTQVFKLTQT